MARMLRAREVLPNFHPTNIYDTRHGTTLSFRQTHSVVDQPESTENPDRSSSIDQNTLCDISDDSLHLKTSILIEKKLPILLPEHSPGDAFLEVEGQEYSAVASTFSRRNSPDSSIGALLQLLELRDFDHAYLLVKDIQDLNILIPPSFVYEAPAQAALRDGDMANTTKIEQFTTWFSLIPPATNNVRAFNETCHLIFQAKVTNLALILSFCKIMASKGYGHMIINDAFPIIMRFSSLEISLNFLDEFNDANAEYWAKHDPNIAAKKAEMLASTARGLAVRILAFSNRVDDALALLPDSDDARFRLTTHTYNVLLRRLKSSTNVVHRQKISLVERLRSQESTALFENDSVSPLNVLAEEAEMASKFKSSLPVDLTQNLVNDLRYMKLAFLHKDLVPHPFTIVNFMNAYLSTGRRRALNLLYNRALRTSYRTLFIFIFAEMLFYHR